jgi:para-nitrobenzyl esterase
MTGLQAIWGMVFLSAVTTITLAEPIRIESGLIEGVRSGELMIYKGVPFAAAPVRDLRWREPQAPPAWKGIRRAESFAPACLQHGVYPPAAPTEPMSEDCLYLNIWTGAKAATAKLPVMVWIHGGGFANGSASIPLYWGDELAQRGVIVVTVNYRIGRLGFMAHPELTRESSHGASGNYGLLDQIAALEWIRRNIAAFGGNPGNVTVFGQSAGSMSACILMSSPLAQGLFQRVIGQSGGVLMPFEAAPADDFVLAGAERNGERFSAALGADSIKALRELPAEKIAAARGNNAAHFTLDGYVLPREPYDTFAAGRQNDVPILIGSNADEARALLGNATFKAATFIADVRTQFAKMLPDSFFAIYSVNSDAEAYAARAELERDVRFGYDMWTWGRLQARTGRGKVFFYNFAHSPPYPPDSALAHSRAGHGAEMPYMFNHLDQQPWQWTAYDRRLAGAMATYWTRFAKYGDPNSKGLPRWPAFLESDQRVMHFADDISAGEFPARPALALLDQYFNELRGRRAGGNPRR